MLPMGRVRTFINLLGALVFVRQNYAAMLHRFGKYERVLKPGLNFKIPFVDRIAFIQDLRERAIEISSQAAITKDNVTLQIDAILFIQIEDPYKASYGVENLEDAITNLAQTTMRSEIGKLTLDKTFEERESLNHHIVNAISSEVEAWGIKCLRYEIRDIDPPSSIKKSMILQAEAERKKRADILTSEGERQSAINVAEGSKTAKTLRAEGKAEYAIKIAEASADALTTIGKRMKTMEGQLAGSYLTANGYIDSYKLLGAKGNSLIMSTSPIEVAKNISEAFDMLHQAIDTTKLPNQPKP